MTRDVNWHGLTNWQARKYRAGKVCEICESSKRMAVDHNHTTGGIRGVICSHCNLLVALVENTTKLDAIKTYLDKYNANPPLLADAFQKYKAPTLRKQVAAHGTLARYNHRSQPCRCVDCTAAATAWDRSRNNRTARAESWGKATHGTYAMYQAERKRGEVPCDACREANRIYSNARNAVKRIKVT